MKPGSASRREYVARINRVIDHIEAHLAEELPLERLAKVACFSPYHFHRIFTAMMGESLHRFIRRLRLERAATQLVANPRTTVHEVAAKSGFSSPATFARAFKDAFGVSASAWRRAQERERAQLRKNGQAKRKDGEGAGAWKAQGETEAERRLTMTLKPTSSVPLDIRVENLAERPLAYLRHIGPYQGDGELFATLFGRLAQWAGPRGLLGGAPEFVSVYHDNPEVTDPANYRVTIGLIVPEGTPVEDEVGSMALPAGPHAVAHCELDVDQYKEAWEAFGAWFPESGYQPADGLAFERYLNDPKQHPEGKHVVELCMPVQPL